MDKLTITGNFDEISVNGVAYGPKQEPNPEPGPTPTPDPDPPAPPTPRPDGKASIGINIEDPRHWKRTSPYANIAELPTYFYKRGPESASFDARGAMNGGTSQMQLSVHAGRKCKVGRYVVTYNGKQQDSFDVTDQTRVVGLSFEGSAYGLDIRHVDDVGVRFNESFASRVAPAQWVRFLDPSWVNQLNWEDVPFDSRAPYRRIQTGQMNTFCYSIMTPEHVAEMSNTFNFNPWIPIPHEATIDNILDYATRLAEHLEPDKLVRVENANEVWNGIFKAHHFGQRQPNGWRGWHADRTDLLGELFGKIFGDRSTAVLSGQLDQPILLDQFYEQCTRKGLKHVGATAVNGYVGGPRARANQKNVHSTFSLDSIHGWVRDDFDSRYLPKLEAWANKAQEYGLILDMYECGLHVSPDPAKQHPVAVERYHDYCQSNMGADITGEVLDAFREFGTAESVACLYVDCKGGPYKCFGLLEYELDPHSARLSAAIERMRA